MKSVDKVKVYCRFRPQLKNEIQNKGTTCIELKKVDKNDVVKILDENRNLKFTFPKIFDTNSSQEDVFNVVAASKIKQLVAGYNVSIFAYGQTGSGKTHTMLNMDENDLGLTPRMIDLIFEQLNEKSHKTSIISSVTMKFYEIYLEKVNDLLDSSKENLNVKENLEGNFYVENLTEIEIHSTKDVLEIVKNGLVNRKVSSTKINEYSSRSHSILSLKIYQLDTESSQKMTSELDVVDLAGSERMNKSKLIQKQEEEAKSINLSLTTLGKVIYALSCNYQHIPIRESKLTKLLSNSLGNGNAFTVLLINCSSSSFSKEETISTLRFGQRAQVIKIKPKLNITKDEELQHQLLKLKKENQNLLKRTTSLQHELRSFKSNRNSSNKIINNSESIQKLSIEIQKKEKDFIKSKILLNEKLNIMMNSIHNMRKIEVDLRQKTDLMNRNFKRYSSKVLRILDKSSQYDENTIVLKCGNVSFKRNDEWNSVWAIISKEFQFLKCYKSIKY
eukprot:gene1815-957_t